MLRAFPDAREGRAAERTALERVHEPEYLDVLATLKERTVVRGPVAVDRIITAVSEYFAVPMAALKRSATVTSFDPLTLLPALAVVTERIGLIATASTTYNEPYHIARKFASLDHISDGRAGSRPAPELESCGRSSRRGSRGRSG